MVLDAQLESPTFGLWSLCTRINFTLWFQFHAYRYTLIHCTHDYFINATCAINVHTSSAQR